MNQYGHKALEFWHRHRPTELAAIEDPEQHFTDLGAKISQAIEALTDQIVPPRTLTGEQSVDLPRVNEARMTAEDEVLRQMVYSTDEDLVPAVN